MTNFDKKIRLYFIECGYIPVSTKAEFIYLSKLLSNDMAQQNDSPIPMQDANKLKAQLKQIELEKTDYESEKKDE